MFGHLLPKDTSFFDLFEQHAALTVDGAHEFVSLVSGTASADSTARRIREIEQETNVITHRCVEALHKTLITPFCPDQIHHLITRMNDVMDYIEAAAGRIALYKLREMTPEVQEFADVLLRTTRDMLEACKYLRNLKDPQAILKKCIDISRLESEADTISRRAVARLFDEEQSPVTIIKWKAIYETLESAADRCEDVAYIIEGVVLEHS